MPDRALLLAFLPALAGWLLSAGAAAESSFAGTACGPRATTQLALSLQLDASAGVTGAFDPGNPRAPSNFQTTMSIVDEAGAEHPLTLLFSKLAPNVWAWNAALDPSSTRILPASPNDGLVVVRSGLLLFDTSGNLARTWAEPIAPELTGSAPGAQTISISFGPLFPAVGGDATTQYDAASALNSARQDGLTLEVCRFGDFLKVVVQPRDGVVQLLPDAVVWVEVYGTAEVPVRALARRSLRFGPARVRPLGSSARTFWRRHERDLNGDHIPDLLLQFPAVESGLRESFYRIDNACIEGTIEGRLFQSCQPVRICGPWCLQDLQPRLLCGPVATRRVSLTLRLNVATPMVGPFDPASPGLTSSFQVPITIFDSLGSGHTATLFLSKRGPDLWEWVLALDPADTTQSPQQPGDPLVSVATGELVFDSMGELEDPGPYPVRVDFRGGSTAQQRVELDFGSTAGINAAPAWRAPSALVTATTDGKAAGLCQIYVFGGESVPRPEYRPLP